MPRTTVTENLLVFASWTSGIRITESVSYHGSCYLVGSQFSCGHSSLPQNLPLQDDFPSGKGSFVHFDVGTKGPGKPLECSFLTTTYWTFRNPQHKEPNCVPKGPNSVPKNWFKLESHSNLSTKQINMEPQRETVFLYDDFEMWSNKMISSNWSPAPAFFIRPKASFGVNLASKGGAKLWVSMLIKVTWFWVKNRVTPKWVALVDETQDKNLWSLVVSF